MCESIPSSQVGAALVLWIVYGNKEGRKHGRRRRRAADTDNGAVCACGGAVRSCVRGYPPAAGRRLGVRKWRAR